MRYYFFLSGCRFSLITFISCLTLTSCSMTESISSSTVSFSSDTSSSSSLTDFVSFLTRFISYQTGFLSSLTGSFFTLIETSSVTRFLSLPSLLSTYNDSFFSVTWTFTFLTDSSSTLTNSLFFVTDSLSEVFEDLFPFTEFNLFLINSLLTVISSSMTMYFCPITGTSFRFNGFLLTLNDLLSLINRSPFLSIGSEVPSTNFFPSRKGSLVVLTCFRISVKFLIGPYFPLIVSFFIFTVSTSPVRNNSSRPTHILSHSTYSFSP